MTATSSQSADHSLAVVSVADHTRYPTGLRVARTVVQIATRHPIETIDLTDQIAAVVNDSGLRTGWVDVCCRHTSCGLILNEHETGLCNDLRTLCGELVQAHPDRLWDHDNLDIRTENLVEGERPNAHSHLLKQLLSASALRVWVEDGQLDLGRWQRIMLAEFDGPRPDLDLAPGQQPVHPIREVVLHLCDLHQAGGGAEPGQRNGAVK